MSIGSAGALVPDPLIADPTIKESASALDPDPLIIEPIIIESAVPDVIRFFFFFITYFFFFYFFNFNHIHHSFISKYHWITEIALNLYRFSVITDRYRFDQNRTESFDKLLLPLPINSVRYRFCQN